MLSRIFNSATQRSILHIEKQNHCCFNTSQFALLIDNSWAAVF